MKTVYSPSFFPTAKEIAGGMKWLQDHPIVITATAAASTAMSVVSYFRMNHNINMHEENRIDKQMEPQNNDSLILENERLNKKLYEYKDQHIKSRPISILSNNNINNNKDFIENEKKFERSVSWGDEYGGKLTEVIRINQEDDTSETTDEMNKSDTTEEENQEDMFNEQEIIITPTILESIIPRTLDICKKDNHRIIKDDIKVRMEVKNSTKTQNNMDNMDNNNNKVSLTRHASLQKKLSSAGGSLVSMNSYENKNKESFYDNKETLAMGNGSVFGSYGDSYMRNANIDIDSNIISPQWGWYVAITPPQDLHGKDNISITSSLS